MAFLFDLDGTLIESKGIISKLVNETLQEFGYSPISEDEMYRYVGMPLEKMFLIKTEKKYVDEMCNRYLSKYLKEGLDMTKPYDGAIDLLRDLKDKNTGIGIITTKSENEAKYVLSYFGFSKYVDVVVGHNINRMPKPNPDPILYACSLIHAEVEKSVMIGDTHIDIQAGKSAGVYTTVGVLWGVGREEDLKYADYTVKTMEDLELTLNKIKGQLTG